MRRWEFSERCAFERRFRRVVGELEFASQQRHLYIWEEGQVVLLAAPHHHGFRAPVLLLLSLGSLRAVCEQ